MEDQLEHEEDAETSSIKHEKDLNEVNNNDDRSDLNLDSNCAFPSLPDVILRKLQLLGENCSK